jgi:YidC/Oxa1 family membrane protein insertase
LILKGDQGSYFFGTSFGDYGTPASKEIMDAKMIDGRTIEFSYGYAAPGVAGEMVPFTFRKRFSFNPGEYLFDVKVSIENSVNAVPNVLNKGFAYTLFLGPQIGPDFKKLSNYDESRTYRNFSNGKSTKYSIKPNTVKELKNGSRWAAVIGKYFTLVAAPDATDYTIIFNTNSVPGVPVTSQMSISRPAVSGSTTVDSFRFYLGPKVGSELGRYNDAKKNALGISGLKISQITDANPLFGWLEVVLKWMLIQCQRLLLNWGLAIMMVTLVIKVVFFPLSLKGSISMAKMSELQPKIAELQAKFKDKPEKLNQEMMEFYKKEGANPLSGCLPMLIQIPIFFAMYSLFNTHFDLRGAMFIPGWISDLSRPDALPGLTFPTVNLIIWKISAIRALPIIYVVSQLFYGKYTQMSQPTPGQNATQMKLMMYGMPIFFFFILYDAPAGLLVYWITQNVLTIIQQVITNRIIHQRKLRRS